MLMRKLKGNMRLSFLYKVTLLVILLVLQTIPTIAGGRTYGTIKVSSVVSVYDGDTFRVNIIGYPEILGSNIRIRIGGIDTPELRDKRQPIKLLAIKAREFSKAMLRNGKSIILKNIRRGKYFRIVAEVYVDGKDLGEALIKAGLAKPYYGKNKLGW